MYMFHKQINQNIFSGVTQRPNRFKKTVRYVIANQDELTKVTEELDEIDNKIEQLIEHPELFEIYDDKEEFNQVVNEKPIEQFVSLSSTEVTKELEMKKKNNISFFNIAKKQVIKNRYKREFE